MKVKKFDSLVKLVSSKEFKNKDLSYCDLSGINLSNFPASTWDGFVFNYTNFTDTGIKFYPEALCPKYKQFIATPYYLVEYCDFTNCDLSYLDSSDIAFTSIKGANFTNTGLDVEFYNGFGKDIDYYWEDLGYKDYSDVIFPDNEKMYETIKKIGFLVNCESIKKNPTIPFSSENIYSAIKKELPSDSHFLTSKKVKELNSFIDEMLKEDEKREGKLIEFFNILNMDSPFTELERIRFFQVGLAGKEFSEIDLSSIPSGLINLVNVHDCSFEKVTFPDYFESNCGGWHFYNNSILRVYLPTVNPTFWRNLKETRLGISRITLHRNLYLELGRACNGRCKFCRNQYLEPCHYDLQNIKKNLAEIRPHIDNIVIGGGEPTLLLEDAYTLKKSIKTTSPRLDWTIFTNASASLGKLIDLGDEFNLNVSRHSISDSINNQILGVKSLSVVELKKLKSAVYVHDVTLCATCFKGDGIDTVEKLEDYIALSDECEISQIMFQTLHKDLNSFEQVDEVLPIEDEIFDEMIIKLEEQGYKIGIPIYSTGDYKLIIAKKGDKTISFKKYITKEELEREWYQACKRTFDLSMDPSGNVYENWHQSSGKVLLKSQIDR